MAWRGFEMISALFFGHQSYERFPSRAPFFIKLAIVSGAE
jgi:hypothetical protein